MDSRNRTLISFLALAASLASAGCGVQQQTKFRMSFLPPSTPTTQPAVLDQPPVVETNVYLEAAPAFLLATPPERQTRADALVRRAGLQMQRGRTYYQAHDIAGARREFDLAIDSILTALDQNPADTQEYQRQLDEMVDTIHRYDLAGLGASAVVPEGQFEKAPLEDILPMTFPVDPRLKDKVREQVASTVSQLPLAVNDTVLGYINYFSNRGHRTIVAATERSGRYRSMIQRIFDEEGVPQELIHLAQAESGFLPRAMSRKAAGGMWQFVKFRGNEYGLRQTPYTDDRMDPEKATRAAARHLHELYSEFGDWYLAIAAYNCGPNVVDRAVERTGYADFWELRSRGVLPSETTNYVPIILAMTIMEKNAAEYGLDQISMDPALEYDTIETSAPTSLTLVSDVTGAPLPELADLNPALLKNIVPEGYALHVPKGGGKQLLAALQLIPSEHRDSWRMHQVGAGETLAAIGKRYGVAPVSIAAANRMQSPEAVEGDRLLIPAAFHAGTVAKRPAPRATTPRATTRRSSVAQRTSKKAPSTKSAAAIRHTRRAPVILARTASR